MISTVDRRQFNQQLLLSSAALSMVPMAAVFSANPLKKEINMYDVIIVGGSYSGLAAGMTLGRSIRNTLIIDSGNPCNEQTPHSHNFITQDGVKPVEIAREAKSQVLEYPTVTFANDLVTNVSGRNHDFSVVTESGKNYKTKKMIFATGVKDIMPDIDGFSECWGITAIHCPYCHGYEVKSKTTGILVNDESADEFARLILNWTDKLTLYTNGKALFDKTELKKLNVPVVEKEIETIGHKGGYMSHLHFKDGSDNQIDALYHRPRYEQHSKIPGQLGCNMTDSGHIAVNDFQQTNIPGIYAVGDATTLFRAVSVASASGTKAGALLNHELITEKYL